MAKKRQRDFCKTQLKPGRSVTRGKNASVPSCKAKKIVMSKKKGQKSERTIPDCLKSIKSGFTASRISALSHLINLIAKEREFFFSYLADVLESIPKLLLDCDDNIRKAAVKLLMNIFDKSKSTEPLEMRFYSFSPLLINILSCGMVHSILKIKYSALEMLMAVLFHYPKLVCNSVTILKNLYYMIVGSPSNSRSSRSSLPIVCDARIDSENLRITVLQCMDMFLKAMMENFKADIYTEDLIIEQELYWDCESPLYLEIYDSGGLKPVDIEKRTTNVFYSPQFNFGDPLILENFIIPFTKLIPQIFIEEFVDQAKADDGHLPLRSLKHLTVLFKVLCHLSDWLQLIPCEEVDATMSRFLLDEIDGRNLFPFSQRGIFSSKHQCTEAVELNLSICFLYGRFLLRSNEITEKVFGSITTFIDSVLTHMTNEVKCSLIPMIAKIMKVYYSMINEDAVGGFIIDVLFHMSNVLKDDYRCEDVILCFIKLSLHPSYKVLSDSSEMGSWYNWLLTRLTEIPKNHKINKNLLKLVKIIGSRKFSLFDQALSAVHIDNFKALLKYDHPDVRDVAIFLIYHLQAIDGNLLEHVSNVILLDTSFPVRYAIRLINLLTCRYTEKPQDPNSCIDIGAFKKERVNFIQFLLNIAVDSLNLTNERWLDYDASEYTKAIEPYQDVTIYNIFPSLQWKEHSKLFEVCQKSLHLLPKKLVHSISMVMFKEILDHTRNMPMHCTIAILKLNNNDLKDRHYRFQINDLMFSALFTTSVLTNMSTEEEWYKYNVVEVMDSMTLSRRIAIDTLQHQLENVEEMDGITAYYILRICKFYLDRQLFKPEDGKRVLNILETIKDKCSDKTFKQQPLFVQLYKIFFMYA